MKTLYGVVRGLKKLTKAKLREPKKFWCVTIDYGNIIWSCYMSEHPSFKLLHEIWELEHRIASSWLTVHSGPEIEHAAWARQKWVAEKLRNIFFSYRNFRDRLECSDTYGITIEEEVLY